VLERPVLLVRSVLAVALPALPHWAQAMRSPLPQPLRL
jgi:hypothetical protein